MFPARAWRAAIRTAGERPNPTVAFSPQVVGLRGSDNALAALARSYRVAYSVKQAVTLDKFRYVLAIAAPHSKYHVKGALALGPQGQRCSVVKDDFQGTWQETEVVSADPVYRTNYGKIHYLQYLVRDHPLIMRPGHVYRLAVNFEPDVTHV